MDSKYTKFNKKTIKEYKSKELIAEIELMSEKIKQKKKGFKNNKPIVINFSGKKGTGKSYYIRYLLDNLNVNDKKIKKIDCKSFEQSNFSYSSFEKEILGYRGKLMSFLSEIRNLYYLIALLWISISFVLLFQGTEVGLEIIYFIIIALVGILIIPFIPLFFNKKTVYIFDELNKITKSENNVQVGIYRFISSLKEKSEQGKLSKYILNLINIDYKKIIIVETDDDNELFTNDLKYIDYVINVERKEIENIKIVRNELSRNAENEDEYKVANDFLSNEILSFYVLKNKKNIRLTVIQLKKIINFYTKFIKIVSKENKVSIDTIIVVYLLYKDEKDWNLFKKLYKDKLSNSEYEKIRDLIKQKSRNKLLFDKLLENNFINSLNNVFTPDFNVIIDDVSKLYLRHNIFEKFEITKKAENFKNLVNYLDRSIKGQEITYSILIEDLSKNEDNYQDEFFKFILTNNTEELKAKIALIREFIFGAVDDNKISWKYNNLNNYFNEIIVKYLSYFKEIYQLATENNVQPLVSYIQKNNIKKIINIPFIYWPLYKSNLIDTKTKKELLQENFDKILNQYISKSEDSKKSFLLFVEILNDGNIDENDLRDILKNYKNENYLKSISILITRGKINKKVNPDNINLYEFANSNIEILKKKIFGFTKN